ncbi:efflux RND transporter permease subunit [Spartinivicinus poritis]|uniref:Efflux RND transporter permease subunit n=1 Tax=Spartinivicinus poritis TaxID=2994640 RepID=A0ABT5UB65_9GAMM|nr:efflux RND transporter permease subunit [Spartinivicinus sp. A2-2]MDE1463626.1 efflux RND transporter permease subunit [Spartinivicinus sp. A2-2]
MEKQSTNSSFMDIFINRPILAIIVSIVLVLLGIRAAVNLPVLQFPKIESTALVITTTYVGASAEVVQGFITEPVERAASTITGIDYIDSTTQAGLSTVKVWLKLNQNSTDALTELSSRIDQISFELPAKAENPSIQIERADRPGAVFYLSVITDHFSRESITDYLTRQVNPTLSSIDGVQRIGIGGGRNPAMRVWIDPLQMAAFNLSAQDIQAALTANNILATLGHSKNNLQRINLLANTTMKTVADFENLIVSKVDNALVKLGDIARIELTEEEGDVNARINQKSAIFISIWAQPGANEIDIGNQLYELLPSINNSLPDGLAIEIASDATLYMREALKEIFSTLLETVFLVGLVVLALMGSIRTAIVPIITIPISILGAIAAMSLLGFSLNLLTILAIVLSVGLVVDDAIVVVENVSRYMREGKSRMEAALISSRQLLLPIVGMTVTLAAVYAPIGFLSGLTGILFKEFAFTLSIAVLISGVIALTLSPIMSAYASPANGSEGHITRKINQQFYQLQLWYGELLVRLFKWRFQVLFIGFFITVLIPFLFISSKKELAPTEDQSEINIIVDAAPESSLDYTTEYMTEVVDGLTELPGIKYIWQVIQPNGGFGGIELVEPKERQQTTQELLPQVFESVSKIAGLDVVPILPSALPSSGNYDVELIVQSPESHENMQQYAEKLISAAYKSGYFMFVDTDLKVDLHQVNLIIDRKRVAELGMDLSSVSQQLSILLSGNYINHFNLDGKAYRVIPMAEHSARQNPESIMNLHLFSSLGEKVPVSAIASFEHIASPRVLYKFQQKNAFRIYGGVQSGITKEQALKTLETAAGEVLPVGYTIDYAGESRQIRQEGNSLLNVMLVALVFVFLVLAVQFNSFRYPLVVLIGSVPLALAGAMLFTFLGWTTINIYSQIGLITLIGLIAKNGILIVEFANQLQENGIKKLDAIKQAAETRLRPILMTTAATVLGHFPLILVSGAGAEARNSIGIILVMGMIIGTLFTLFFLPCIYLVLGKNDESVENSHQSMPIVN